MKNISLKELYKQMKKGPVAVFDVRGDLEYEKGHIPDSKTAPLGSLVFRVRDIMNPDSKVVLYSQNEKDGMAKNAASRLENLGMRNIYILKEGLKGWKSAGMQVKESIDARKHARGPVVNCRPIIVDRERAYGGAFKSVNMEMEGAGG